MLIAIFKKIGKGKEKETVIMATFEVADEDAARTKASDYIGQWSDAKSEMFWDELSPEELESIREMEAMEEREALRLRAERFEARQAAASKMPLV